MPIYYARIRVSRKGMSATRDANFYKTNTGNIQNTAMSPKDIYNIGTAHGWTFPSITSAEFNGYLKHEIPSDMSFTLVTFKRVYPPIVHHPGIEGHLSEVENTLAGLDEQIVVLSSNLSSGQGLGDWYNPLDWGKSAWGMMKGVDNINEICKQIYYQMQNIYGQAQDTFTEIATFWRGLINDSGDMDNRLKILQARRTNVSVDYEKAIAQVKKDGGPMAPMMVEMIIKQRDKDLKIYDAQIESYRNLVDNIKKMGNGMWGPASPWGKFVTGVQTFATDLTTTFNNYRAQFDKYVVDLQTYFKTLSDNITAGITAFQTTLTAEIDKISKDWQKQFTDFTTQFNNYLSGIGTVLKDFTKNFDGYVKQFNISLNNVWSVLAHMDVSSTAISKGVSDFVKQMMDLLSTQKTQLTAMQNINVDAKSFYTEGAKFFKDATDLLRSIDMRLTLPSIKFP